MKKYLVGFSFGLLAAFSLTAFAKGIGLFTDVPTTAWYSAAVQQMANIGVVSGYPDGSFKPSNPVTRAEVVQMFARMKEYVDARVDGTPIPGPRTITAPITTSPVLSANADNSCRVINPPVGSNEIVVSNAGELATAVDTANENGNTTITIKNGSYTLSAPLWIRGNNVLIHSQSGNRDSVVIRGQGMDGAVSDVIQIAGDNVTVADVTLGWVANHPIQVHGEFDADNVLIHNVRIVDGREQLVKISYDESNMAVRSDNGVVECSLFEYTAGIGPQYYIGGIDGHNAKNWIVRDNTFKNITSPVDTLAEHAIHFWSKSEGTLVERNVIINSDRGIGFGLYEGRGHIGGTIRDNKIYHNATKGDVGIGLYDAQNVTVSNNTIFFENTYPNAIEYRFSSTTGAQISGNLTNRAIVARDGASGSVTLNTTNATADLFINPSIGDLRLKL